MTSCKWCNKNFRRNKKNRIYCSSFCRKNGNNFYKKGKGPKYHQTWYWSPQQGKKVRLKSSYELTYCEYLDKNNIQWFYEPKRFYMDDKKTYYVPDFYLPETDEWKEVKGKWYEKSIQKYMRFKVLYPKEKISIVGTNEIMDIRKSMKNYSNRSNKK